MIRLAFTGTGGISRVHAFAAQKIPGVELVAVVNHRWESMEHFAREFNISRKYTKIEDLLNDGNVDAILVNTPNYLHAQQTIPALNTGVHVMVEKPMAMNAVEAAQMLAAAQASGSFLMIAHCWRFDHEVLWLRNQVASGLLGEIIRTKSYAVHVDWGPSGWFTQKRFAGGGAMADMGVHALDTARFLLGDPTPRSVYAKIGTYYGDFDVDDTGVCIVTWDDGSISYFESGWWQPHADGPAAATQLYATRGFGQLFPTRIKVANEDRTSHQTIDPKFVFPREHHNPQSMYDNQLAYFVHCIQEGTSPTPGGSEGLINMQVVDAAYQSSQEGQVVTLSRD